MRLLPSAIALTAFVLLGHDAAAGAIPQDTIGPVTGRAIPCDSGRIKIFECNNVELLSFLPRSAIGDAGGTDLWGWIDSTTGREFAVISASNGTSFVEVTDPVNPKYLGKLPFHNGATGTGGVKVYKNHAFIVVEYAANAGMQIFDLTQLRDVKAPPVEFKETAHYANFGNAHTITMNEASGFAYPTGITDGGETCGKGLHMIDVRTPTKPTFAGCYANTEERSPLSGAGFVHDAQCVIYRGPDKQYKGREICLNSSASALVLVDVTDKRQPKLISVARYPNVGYVHQGWFTEDQRYFFLDDELDEATKNIGHTRTIVFDMNDLDDPVVLTEFLNPNTTATDHNLYIRGRYMYQGNYAAGLRIIDIVDPKNPKEVGYLTSPWNAWTTYPFFKNDVVAVSMRGLFLVKLRSK